jgi:hypothetical protein
MAQRNRVIYQSEALYVSKNIASTTSNEHAQLRRVQSANYNFSIERQDVNQFGQLARIDSLVLKSPTVSLDLTYYPTDGYNEKLMGFYVQTGTQSSANFVSGQMGNSSGQNYYIITAEESSDLNTLTGATALAGKQAIGIGNGFLSNYTFNASVGNIPTVSVTIEALNIKSVAISGTYATGTGSGVPVYTGNYLATPAIDPVLGTDIWITGAIPSPDEASIASGYLAALRPGDITLDLGAYGASSVTGATPISKVSGSEGTLNIQSASISVPLSRTPIERLGSRFAFARVVDFPIVATLNVSAILNDIEAKNLAQFLDDSTKRDISLTVRKPGSSLAAMRFDFKGSQLQSESFSSSIGANKTVDLVFQTQIGGPTDSNNGIYLSGSYTDYVSGNWGYSN